MSTPPRIRLAYFGSPHVGGTHSVYRALKAALEPASMGVDWMALAAPNSGVALAEDGQTGTVVTYESGASDREQAAAVMDAVARNGYDGVIVNVLADPILTALARYLPRSVKRIMFVHSTSRGTYAAAKSVRDFVHHTVAVSPRIRDDLVSRHGFDGAKITQIPNAFVGPFEMRKQGSSAGPLRVAYLGRLDDSAKGVLLLPKIFREMPSGTATLDLIGEGPEEGRLRKLFGDIAFNPVYLGAVAPSKVAHLLRDYDCLVAPSRYEGFGLSVVEAMASGVVPVASRISGVTDTIVEHGRDGFLFPVGDFRGAARAICNLAADRSLLGTMSRNAHAKAFDRFSLDKVGGIYRDLFVRVFGDSDLRCHPEELSKFVLPAGLRPSAASCLPEWMKVRLRWILERVRS